jgi:hypothetical protein
MERAAAGTEIRDTDKTLGRSVLLVKDGAASGAVLRETSSTDAAERNERT